MMSKGSGCSISGKNYELHVYNIIKKCKLNNLDFNTQSEDNLGCCSSNNDIECNLGPISIPIENKIQMILRQRMETIMYQIE